MAHLARCALACTIALALLGACAVDDVAHDPTPLPHHADPTDAPALPPPLAPDDQLWSVLRHLARGPSAAERTASLDHIARTMEIGEALRRKGDVDPAVWAAIDKLTLGLKDERLKGVYQALDPQPGTSARTLRVRGTLMPPVAGKGPKSERFRTTLVTPDLLPLATHGDYETGVTLEPIDAPKDVILALAVFFQIHAGDVAPDGLARAFGDYLAWVERAAAAPPAGARPEGALRGEDLGVLARLAGSFPEAGPIASQLVVVRDVVWIDHRDGRPVTQVQLVVTPNLELIEARYPQIYDYIVKVKTTRYSRATLKDVKGRELAEIVYDGPNLEVRVRMAIHDGRLVPLMGASLEPGLDFCREGVQEGSLSLDFRVNVFGLEIAIEEWPVAARLDVSPTRFAATYHITELPRVIRVTGRLWGVLPVWMVESMLPSRLEVIIREFLDRLIRGSRGQGVTLAVGFDRVRPGHTLYGTRLSGELVDNGFVGIQSRLVEERMAPRKQARGEMGDLFAAFVAALKRDFARHRAQVAAAPAR